MGIYITGLFPILTSTEILSVLLQFVRVSIPVTKYFFVMVGKAIGVAVLLSLKYKGCVAAVQIYLLAPVTASRACASEQSILLDLDTLSFGNAMV